MELNDIVYLKSDNEKLMITWLVGITQNDNYPFDVNKVMMKQPNYQTGDIAVKYNNDKKATIPGSCLIKDLSKLVKPSNEQLSVGNVVKHKLTDDEMTIVWIVGQKQEEGSIINLNQVYRMQGFEDDDIVCGFFEKKEYKTKLIRKGEIEKIFE